MPRGAAAVPTSWPGRTLLTLVVAWVGARACVALGTPLPWMIGPLLATAALSMAGAPLMAPRPLRNAGQWVIGTTLGLYFTAEVLAAVSRLWWGIALGVVWALLLGQMAYRLQWRLNGHMPGVDRAAAFFASAIGGASEMAVMAERRGARLDLVAAAHSMRILIVVVSVPFGLQWLGVHGLDRHVPGPRSLHLPGLMLLTALTLVGVALLRRLDWPNPFVLGSLAVSAGLTAAGVELSAMPRVLVDIGQLFIGIALGTTFRPGFLHTAPRWLATTAAGTVLMILASAAMALLLSRAMGLPAATLVLATAPGGIAEMSLTARVLELGVPVVTAFQAVRYVAVLVLTPLLFEREARRHAGAH